MIGGFWLGGALVVLLLGALVAALRHRAGDPDFEWRGKYLRDLEPATIASPGRPSGGGCWAEGGGGEPALPGPALSGFSQPLPRFSSHL